MIDALWPNEETDAARSAYGVALFRLRSLLGSHALLETKGGSISINSNLVWIDAVAFDRITIANNGAAETDAVRRALEVIGRDEEGPSSKMHP